MANVGPTFICEWDNEDGCVECEKELLAGDSAAYIDDELGCEECAKEIRARQTSVFTRRWKK